MNPFRAPGQMKQRTQVLAQAPAPAVSDGVATLRLYDPIDSWGGYWGVSAKEFVEALDALPTDTSEIRVLINSPGGEVFEGIAILNALRSHSAKTVAVVEGIAASAASFIAAGCDELVMMQNSELYIHNAWVLAVGDAADLRVTADDLEQHFDRNIAAVYAAKSGDSVEHWLEQMGQDRFLSAQQAVDEKLADRIEGVGSAAEARARFDLSVFDRSARAGSARGSKPPADQSADHPHPKEDVVAHDDLTAGLRERLGISDASASDDSLLAAVDEALAGRAETISPPAGTQLIDSEVLAGLQADAAQGRAAREEQIRNRREGIVSAALKEGRISAASRDQWFAMLEKDEAGAAALLSSLPQNTIPVAEHGHSDEPATAEDVIAAKAGWNTNETEV